MNRKVLLQQDGVYWDTSEQIVTDIYDDDSKIRL